MGTAIVSLAPAQSTDAEFRAWGKGVSDALKAVGLVQTANTGQIDWATVLAPSAANQIRGSEIFRFSDALQSTAPVFIRLGYGSGGTAATPAIHLRVGNTTDGAVTFPDRLSAQIVLNYNNSSTTARSCYFSAGSNRVIFSLFEGVSTIIFASIERTKNSDGSDSGEGVLISTIYASSTKSFQYFDLRSNEPSDPLMSDSGLLMPLGTSSSAYGTDIATYPNYHFRAGFLLNPGVNLLGYLSNDFSANQQAIVPVYGVNRNYYVLNVTGALSSVTRGSNSSAGLLILWE